MEASKLNEILDQHRLWIETNGMQGTSANLINADLTGATLEFARLHGANLYGANLYGANLTGAFLTGATLTSAKLINTDLQDANLRGANLYGASLYGAKLNRANLSGANLHAANLTHADLTHADLTGANLHAANLGYANLTGAIGLPNVSWVIPGCLAHLNNIMDELYLKKENKLVNFVQDSFGFIIQNNGEEGTFDMLVEDRVIRNIPDWVKYSGLKQIESESV